MLTKDADSRIVGHPIDPEDMEVLRQKLPRQKASKPHAFVLGHGLWNDLEFSKTHVWLDAVLETTEGQLPYLREQPSQYHRLFMTPSAAGTKKPDFFITRQGNIALARFEQEIGPYVQQRGMDHLGTWNMTIQSSNWDGT